MRSRKPKKAAPPTRGRMLLLPAGPCPQPGDFNSDAAYLNEILAWTSRLWPFVDETEPLGIFSVPKAVWRAFPPYRAREFAALAAAVQAEHRAVAEGSNKKFEQVLGALSRDFGPAADDRTELIRLSAVGIPVLEWIVTQSQKIARLRATVTRLRRQYRKVLEMLKEWPEYTPAAAAEIDVVYRYLAGIPTKRDLSRWRRAQGINRRTSKLWHLHVWTPAAASLVEYLAGRIRRANPVQTTAAQSVTLAEHYTAALLLARYPAAMPTADLARLEQLIRLRINRKK